MNFGFFKNKEDAVSNSQESVEIVRDIILDISKQLVEDTDAVRIDIVSEDKIFKLCMTASKKDIGKLIGKEGRMAASLRTIVYALASKYKVRTILDISHRH